MTTKLEKIVNNGKRTARNMALTLGLGSSIFSPTVLAATTYSDDSLKSNPTAEKTDSTSTNIDNFSSIQEREKLIQQAYAKMEKTFGTAPNELVNSFNYDADNEIMRKLDESNYSAASRDPRFIKMAVQDQINNNPNFKNGKLTEAVILAYFRTPDGQKKLQNEFAPIMMKSLATTDVEAAQVQYPFDFGIGEKSDVVFFPAAFERKIIDTRKGDYTVAPTTESLELLARHELHHSYIAKNGIKIGGMQVTNSKYTTLDKDVLRFAIETEVLLADLEYAKGFEKKTQKSHSDEYLLTLLRLGSAIVNGKNAAEKNKLDPESRRVYDSRMDELKTTIEYTYRTLVEAGWKGMKEYSTDIRK